MGDTNSLIGRFQQIILFGAPILALYIVTWVDLAGSSLVTSTAAVAVWMALWWLSGVAPMGTTALLPIVLFPVLGIMSAKEVSGFYINDSIFLFLGGFLIALAMQRWNLHKRIALRLMVFFGVKPRRLMMGFFLPSFFLSMWISNTATTMMMVPIALSVIAQMEQDVHHPMFHKYTIGLLCGIAYSSSIGGTATLIGTVPNIVFINTFATTFPDAPEISFAQWFFFAFPVAIVLAVSLWGLLMLMYCPRGDGFALNPSIIHDQYKKLGKMSYEEKVVGVAFVSVALLWLTRSGIVIGDFSIPGWSALFSNPKDFKDGTVGIFVAIILFLVPSKSEPDKKVMDWETAKELPWEILLLIGGGFALAGAFASSGLSLWIGGLFANTGVVTPILLVLLLCLSVSILTEFTSNTATCQILLPILATVAISLAIHPLFLMIPTTLACSFAFMLPVATPPNAIIFGTRRITVAEMVRTGVTFNFLAVILLSIAMVLLGDWVFGIHPGELPDWAVLTKVAE